MFKPEEGIVRKHLRKHLQLVVLSALLAGCATTTPTRVRWEGTSRTASQDIIVVVENLVWNDVVIYSEADGSRRRLGSVVTGMKGRFRLPDYQVNASNLVLIADPIGSSSAIRSLQIFAMPGQEVRWTVHERRSLRTLTIW